MTSYIFGPGDSLTLWRSGRTLAKGAGSPGFNPRWKLGVKFPTWNILFLLFLRSIGVQYDPQKILFRFIKLQTLPPSKKRGGKQGCIKCSYAGTRVPEQIEIFEPFSENVSKGYFSYESSTLDFCSLSKNLQFMPNPHKTWWEWSTNEVIIFNKFHKIGQKV